MSINYIELNKILNLLTQYQKSELLIVTKNREKKDIQFLIQKGLNLFGENKLFGENLVLSRYTVHCLFFVLLFSRSKFTRKY